MKAAKKKEAQVQLPKMTAMAKIAEGGKTFKPGDTFDPNICSMERLAILIVKDLVWPEDGVWELPEPLFTEVMVLRD